MDSTVIPSALVGMAVMVIGYLLNRSIAGLDKSMSSVAVKVDTLTAKDGAIEVMLAELRVRVSHVESELVSISRKQ